MKKRNLRALVEAIVVEALEEWMDECDCDEADMNEADGVDVDRAFGGGAVEKKPKKAKKKA